MKIILKPEAPKDAPKDNEPVFSGEKNYEPVPVDPWNVGMPTGAESNVAALLENK